jgi:hypothetical protein
MIRLKGVGHKGRIVANLEPHPRCCVCPLAMTIDLFKRIVFFELPLAPKFRRRDGEVAPVGP